MIGEREFQEAERRGWETYENVPHLIDAVYYPALRRILLTFDSGLEIALRQDDYSWMCKADADELNTIEILTGGHTLLFPKLDEGFSIPELLEHLLHVRRFLKRQGDEERDERANRAA